MKTIILQKVRATILSHVFNSSFLSHVRVTPSASCPMVNSLDSFQPLVYLFLVYHKHEGGKVGDEEDGIRHKSKTPFRTDCRIEVPNARRKSTRR
jgi:hypothetical protein